MANDKKTKFRIVGKGEDVMITLQDQDGIFFEIDINEIEEVQSQNNRTWIVTTDGRTIQTSMASEAVMLQIMRARLLS